MDGFAAVSLLSSLLGKWLLTRVPLQLGSAGDTGQSLAHGVVAQHSEALTVLYQARLL